MNTKIIIGALAGVAIVGAGLFFMTTNRTNEVKTSACADLCQKANQSCPSLINESNCNNKCDKLSAKTKKHLQESTTCEQITSKPDLIADLLIPETATPKPVNKNASECEAACGSYVGKCLTLVPNATEALFADGLQSCMKECAGWQTSKINCMIKAFDCESFTNICGL
jgi:hypothetical protein